LSGALMLSFAVIALCIGALVAADSQPNEPPKCKMTGMAYPPSLEPLPDGTAKTITTYTVNLDEPAATRWKHVVEPNAAQILNLTHVIFGTLEKIFGAKLMNNILTSLRASLPKYYARLPEDFGEELAGIADATGIDSALIFIYNIFYTVFGACTSIVAEDAEGSIWHARNLDFGIWPALYLKDGNVWELTHVLRPIVINVDFTRGGKLVYKSTTFAGFVGAHTAMRPGKDGYALTIDSRFDDNLDLGLIEWFNLDKPNTDVEVTMLCRQVMQAKEDLGYQKALETVNTTKVIGPAYIIMSGTGNAQGAVVTKGASKPFAPDGRTVDLWTLDSIVAANNTYFMVQTNYDHNEAPPGFDNRRDPAKLCMKELGRKGFDFKGLYNVLEAKPNLNDLTAYTTLMHTSSGKFESYREFCRGIGCPLV